MRGPVRAASQSLAIVGDAASLVRTIPRMWRQPPKPGTANCHRRIHDMSTHTTVVVGTDGDSGCHIFSLGGILFKVRGETRRKKKGNPCD